MVTDTLVQEAKALNPTQVGGDGVAVVRSNDVAGTGVQLPPESDAAVLPPKKLSESDFVIIPSYSKWFDWNNIHDCEVRSLPEFFDSTSAFKNPTLYKYLRNSIIKKFRVNPATRITFTEVRRILIGDVVSIRRVFDFLETWGLINYSPSTKQQQTVVPRLDDNKDITPSKSIDSAESASSERGKKFCSGCKSLCTIACFVSDRYDLVLCARCYVRGNYRVGLNHSEFRRVEITENVKTNWTEKETLHLLEALMHYGENWKRVAEHVGGGRTDKECVARFIKLPFGEQYVDPFKVEDEDNNLQIRDLEDTETTMETSAKKVRLTPLADASNPIMAQAAFLSALAGTEVAEAAAEAAVAALHDADTGTGQGVIPSRSIHAIGTGHKSGDAFTLHAVGVEEAKAGEAEILLNGEEDIVEDVITSITQVQMEEFQDKLSRYEEMELQLEKERQQLDQMRHQLFLDQVTLLFHKGKGATSERSGAAIVEEKIRAL